jgi:predicted ATPase/DNA-binding SARP family transcriptional activator
MEFRILGPLRVLRGNREIAIGPPAQRRLLAVLLTRPNEPVTVDRLIDELWDDQPPRSAQHLVHVYASRLRGLLNGGSESPRLTRASSGYVLQAGRDEVDAERFLEASQRGRETLEHDPDAASETLNEALRLWRGSPFADLPEAPPTVREYADRLTRRHRQTQAAWVEAELVLGHHRALIPALSGFVAEEPYDESLHGQLMLALYRSGRQADALETGRALRARLRDDLGLDPAPDIVENYRRILVQDPELLLGPPEPPSNLPATLTSFIGRMRELEQVSEQVASARLSTLTGPGGVGKTRLALEVARRQRRLYPDGTWWVDLAQVTDPSAVAEAVAAAMGLAASPGRDLTEALAVSLGRRRALLLLDNCEHVVGGVAPLVTALLQAADHPRILATSRVPLEIEGERLWPVPPLDLPATGASPDEVADADAVRLFVERARSADPAFVLDDTNSEAVVDICRRLDGLSLAIEMAAARVPVLSPREIVAHLDERFSFLELSAQGRLTRHRTMAAAIDASYVLLGEQERAVFARLAAFAGAFDLDAVVAVGFRSGAPGAAALKVVGSLIDASMVTTDRIADGTRYRLLETLRDYGLARLREQGLEDDVRQAHADYHLGLTEAADATLGTPAFAQWTERLTSCWADVRSALEWSLEQEPRAWALRAAPALTERWVRRGEAREAGRYASRMLEGDLADAPARQLAWTHGAASFAAALAANFAEAGTHAQAMADLLRGTGDIHGLVFSRWMSAHVAFGLGDLDGMRRHAHNALDACESDGAAWDRAGPLSCLGYAALFGGQPEEAGRWFGQAASLYREMGDPGQLVLSALVPWTEAALRRGDATAAERLAVEAIEAGVETIWEASALIQYAMVLHVLGDEAAAVAASRRGLKLALDAGMEQWFRMALRELARAFVPLGQPERAATFLAASRRGIALAAQEPAIYGPVEAACREALGDATYEDLSTRGSTMSHDELVDLVFAQ